MLNLTDVHAYYGHSHILHGISLEVKEKQLVCLLGRNGMGKSTTLKSIMQFVQPRQGRVEFQGRELNNLAPEMVARGGIAYVPEDRRIFAGLTVEENLVLATMFSRQTLDGWNLERVYEMFPVLHKRRRHMGNQLSGGEQQMVAIGRGLISNPHLLLLDEPSEGLAPILVDTIADTLAQIKQEGLTIMLVEQHLHIALDLGDYFYILSKGHIPFSGDRAAIDGNPEIRERYLGV